MGLRKSAAAASRKAIELKDDLAEATFNLGVVLQEAGLLGEAGDGGSARVGEDGGAAGVTTGSGRQQGRSRQASHPARPESPLVDEIAIAMREFLGNFARHAVAAGR